jgi:ABC-type glycerol-3-phosphate transport system substrate-binding protein
MRGFAARARFRPSSWRRGRAALVSLTAVVLAVAVGACGGSSSNASTTGSSSGATTSQVASTGTSNSGPASGPLTVWVDAVRLPAAQAYAKSHPNVQLHIVTFDGDGNGATTLQTKIQLWNRTGNGWPDVIFSEQVNDPVWMAQKPFDYAAPVTGLISPQILSQWPAASTAQCTVNGTQYCVQDNIAQDVLWVNKKLMDQFGYKVPTTWQQWAAIGADVAKNHPGYVIGTSGESFAAWIYLWADQCPLETLQGSKLLINSTDVHCTRMASLLDPLIANGTLPPLSVFTPDFAKKYGGAHDKVLMMPGPTWYGHAVFDQTLHIPAGQITTAMPLQWNSEPLTTGQVGGGPWIISRHSKNLKAAADFVTWETTVFNPLPTTSKDARPGYPAYAPLAASWLASLAKDSYFAADPGPAMKAAANLVWKGWSIVTYPDQPVWSNTVVTQLLAHKTLSSLLPAFGNALAQAAQAAGYDVTRH